MRRHSIGAALFLALWFPAIATAWDARAHDAVLQEAIRSLSKPLKGFYERHRREMPSQSPDRTKLDHGPDRRFAIDRIAPFPFRDVPRTEADLGTRLGEEAKAVGRLPWLVRESYERLLAGMRAGDKGVILTESDAIASLIAELHNPLALSENSDGQKAGQPGLWVRFSERFPARMARLEVDADAAHLIDDPAGYVFSIMGSSYVWLDNIIHADGLARTQDPSYSGVYFETLDERAGSILRDRLSWAARDAASYWYTAWIAAGRPALR